MQINSNLMCQFTQHYLWNTFVSEKKTKFSFKFNQIIIALYNVQSIIYGKKCFLGVIIVLFREGVIRQITVRKKTFFDGLLSGGLGGF